MVSEALSDINKKGLSDEAYSGLLDVLTAACTNDANLLLLPSLTMSGRGAEGGLLPAAVRLLRGANGGSLAAASLAPRSAVRLLSVAATNDGVRKAVSAALAAGDGEGLGGLLELLSKTDIPTQVGAGALPASELPCHMGNRDQIVWKGEGGQEYLCGLLFPFCFRYSEHCHH